MPKQDQPSVAPYLRTDEPSHPVPPPLSRRARWIGYAIFSGLLIALIIGLAVIVHPPLIDDVRRFLPLLTAIGFASTVGGFWWLWWRPR